MKEHEAVMYALKSIIEDTGISRVKFCQKHNIENSLFNPARTIGVDGKPHWPTARTISKVLKATGYSWEEYGEIVDRLIG